MRNTGLDETQAGIKISGRNINNLRYAGDYHSNDRKPGGTEEPLNEGKRSNKKLV